MRAVNLLPLDAQQHKSIRQEDPAVVIGSALGVIVMIALSGSFLTAHSKAGAQQKRLATARLELAQFSNQRQPTPKPHVRQAPLTPIVPSPAITGQEASWLGAVSSTLSQRIAWDRVLREVSLVMPEDVTLSTLTMSAPVGIAGAVPLQGFVVAGSTYSYDSVARLLSRLALVPDLATVTLTSSSALDSGEVQFNITAAVKGAPAPPAPVVAPVTPVDLATTTEASS